MVESNASAAFGTSKTLLTPEHRESVFNFVRGRYPTATFERLYDDEADGRTLKSFYSKVANKGWTITIVKTQSNKVFGGFTQAEWNDGPESYYKADNKAFIFSVDT